MVAQGITQIGQQSQVRAYGLIQIALLHLLPGALVTAVFVVLAAFGAAQGWPATRALLLAWPVAGIPWEVGWLLVQGYRTNGRLSLAGVVLYREPMPVRQYLWLVPLLLVWSALASTLFFPVGEALRQAFFPAWPDWLLLSTFAQNLGRYPAPLVWTVALLSLVLNVAVPVVEELYFRGYLLPRMAPWGRWAPLMSIVLFSLYHFWLPWDNLGRIVALLPVVYAVWWKRSVYLSIWTHVLLNSLGSLALLALAAQRL